MSVKKTITTIFLVPTLGVPKGALVENGFINAFSKDSNSTLYDSGVIYLLFKPENIDKFREFLQEEYERTDNIVDEYDYSYGYVVLVYRLDTKISSDITLIKEGKYSKTSKEFQNLFPPTIAVKRGSVNKIEPSLQVRIFKKSRELREYWENKIGEDLGEEQEVWETYDESKEILNLKGDEYV